MEFKKQDKNADKEEIQKLIKELPVQKRVKAVALHYWMDKKYALDDELEGKIQQLQREYDIKSQPFYEKQNELIEGKRAPDADELVDQEKFAADTEKDELKALTVQPQAIKNFWQKVLTNHDLIKQLQGDNKQDEQILAHLTRVELAFEADSQKNFTVIFTFSENEWFTNTQLKKKFIFDEKVTSEDEEPIKTEGTAIDWKEGKNVTVKTISKKQKNKKTGQTRQVQKKVQTESFFTLFDDTDVQELEKLEDEDKEKMEDKLGLEYEVGRAFLEEIVPFSVEFYLNINPDDGFEDEDEDDDFEDEDEDDDDDDDKKKKKKKDRKKSGDSKKSDRKKSGDNKETKDDAKPECKNQ